MCVVFIVRCIPRLVLVCIVNGLRLGLRCVCAQCALYTTSCVGVSYPVNGLRSSLCLCTMCVVYHVCVRLYCGRSSSWSSMCLCIPRLVFVYIVNGVEFVACL